MEKCFVIQLFDNDKFDKRFKDVYSPAIFNAGYEPYRVDKDLSAEIPIESIDNNIRTVSAVLADITIDNPNVWFEVGLAIAYKKRTILICSDERNGKYPFDIQQRSIISYKTSSLSDYENLKTEITNKLKVFSGQKKSIIESEVSGQILSESIVSDEALLLLGTIGQNVFGQKDSVSLPLCAEKFENLGYNRLAFNFALEELCDLNFLEQATGEYDCPECMITSDGFLWMRKNKNHFNLTITNNETSAIQMNTDDNFPEEIPF